MYFVTVNQSFKKKKKIIEEIRLSVGHESITIARNGIIAMNSLYYKVNGVGRGKRKNYKLNRRFLYKKKISFSLEKNKQFTYIRIPMMSYRFAVYRGTAS